MRRSSPRSEPSIESVLESPSTELSVDSKPFIRSILIPRVEGKYVVHQAEPQYLVRLNTSGRLPGIPEGAVRDRLTHCHSSLRHGTHTVGLGIVLQVPYKRSTLVGCGSSPCTDGIGQREAVIRVYHPWGIARAFPGSSVSLPDNTVVTS